MKTTLIIATALALYLFGQAPILATAPDTQTIDGGGMPPYCYPGDRSCQ